MVVSCLALGGADVTDAAMAMSEVVPVHEASSPSAGLVGIGEALCRELRPVLGGAKQRFGVVNVTHLPSHNLATVQIQDQKQEEPSSRYLCGQIRHVPAPPLTRFGGEVNAFCAGFPNPYLNFHCSCQFAEAVTDANGNARKYSEQRRRH